MFLLKYSTVHFHGIFTVQDTWKWSRYFHFQYLFGDIKKSIDFTCFQKQNRIQTPRTPLLRSRRYFLNQTCFEFLIGGCGGFEQNLNFINFKILCQQKTFWPFKNQWKFNFVHFHMSTSVQFKFYNFEFDVNLQFWILSSLP